MSIPHISYFLGTILAFGKKYLHNIESLTFDNKNSNKLFINIFYFRKKPSI